MPPKCSMCPHPPLEYVYAILKFVSHITSMSWVMDSVAALMWFFSSTIVVGIGGIKTVSFKTSTSSPKSQTVRSGDFEGQWCNAESLGSVPPIHLWRLPIALKNSLTWRWQCGGASIWSYIHLFPSGEEIAF